MKRDAAPFAWEVAVGLRFEPFLALWSLESPQAQGQRGWARQTRLKLRADGRGALKELGNAAEIWAMAVDLPGLLPVDCAVADLTAAIAALPAHDFALALLESALHDRAVALELMADNRTPAQAMAALPPKKREWLAHIGLFPFDAATPIGRAVALLLQDAPAARQAMILALDCFWRDAFENDWRELRPRLEQSAARARELLTLRPWREIAPQLGHHLGLNIEIDSKRRELVALRGGYRLPFKKIALVHFIPSAFNEARFWTTLAEDQPLQHVCLPYFDPAVSVAEGEAAPVDVDVALVFRALGDATRFAIAQAIARRPMQAVEIARLLGLSKPTVTHHLHELRQASLITEQAAGGVVLLGLARDVIAAISGETERRLFARMPEGELRRSRRK